MKTYVIILMTMTCTLANAKPTENVQGFLKRCYTDYVGAFASTDKESDSLSAKIREKCISKEFNRVWFKTISKANADGLLLAQDSQKSWKTHIAVKDLNIAKQTAKVILGEKNEQHCVNISYIKEPDVKIDFVSKCKDN